MHLLLPPSETKRSGGGRAFVPETLTHHTLLHRARGLVRHALGTLSRDADAAARALKLGVKNRGELAHNLALDSSGAMPAIERYEGVLYDALDVGSLPPVARAWVDLHVSVQSALFGLVSARDQIPAYRLSASTRLPALATPLKKVWREAHDGVDWAGLGWVLDLRSKDYAAFAPVPAGLGCSLHVAQRGPNGEVRALNHFNKAAKGDLVRRLALSEAHIDGVASLLHWAQQEGLELTVGPGADELTLVTSLGAPADRPKATVRTVTATR